MPASGPLVQLDGMPGKRRGTGSGTRQPLRLHRRRRWGDQPDVGLHTACEQLVSTRSGQGGRGPLRQRRRILSRPRILGGDGTLTARAASVDA